MPVTDEKTSLQPQFVEVALPILIRKTFTYRILAEQLDKLRLGSRVLVPFGKRSLTGYAVVLHSDLDPSLSVDESEIRSVIELIDEEPLLTEEVLRLTQWTADYYMASWGELLKASLPAGINSVIESFAAITDAGRAIIANVGDKSTPKYELLRFLAENGETSRRELISQFGDERTGRILREFSGVGAVDMIERSVASKVKPKHRKSVRLLPQVGLDNPSRPPAEQQQRILDLLEAQGGEMLFADLLERAETGASPINTLAKRGFLEVSIEDVRRDPLANASLPEPTKITLNDEQQFVLDEIEQALDSREYKAFLLHGVTGSGKTEVYIRAMRSTLENGRSALMLVPEIALTPILSRRLRAVFGNAVAILHSNLSPGERFDEWRRIRSGNALIAIGTRSAVFAPLHNLGLVIVDEEHDASYRQNESPFYHARDVAVVRANAANAVIVLGSATPALESYYNAQAGKYRYLQLQKRIGGRPLASAELIDMREVFRKAGKDVVLSQHLIEAIEETHRKGEQSIILLNRRGFSSFVLCRSCGESLRCKNCDITMTFHRRGEHLRCHYCNYTARAPSKCPFCESEYLYFIGQGTEQLEDIVAKRFKHLKVARVDRDTMSRKGEMAETLLAFDRGALDMLVGTQILAKGHDFHNVTLVGVISVDTGLGLPDLRSAERTFQLLTQVAGRAGRGVLPGRVLIQTYYPEHYVLRYASKQDYEGFYENELRFRQRLGYPPVSSLASILVRHSDRRYAQKHANMLKDSLASADAEKACRVIGPAPAPISLLKNKHRIQLLIKCENRKTLRNVIDIALADAEHRGCDMRAVSVEIDPIDLL